MLKITYICDACGKELETKKVSVYGEETTVLAKGKTDYSAISEYYDLCKECCANIDKSLLAFKLSVLTEKS